MAERRSRTTLVVFLAFLLVFLVVNVLMVGPYLLAVLMGWILCLLARPLHRWLKARRLGPRLSAGMVTLLLLALIVGPLGAFVSVAAQQGQAVIKSVARSQDLSIESILDRINRVPVVRAYVGDADKVEDRFRAGLENLGRELSSSLLAAAGSLPDKILQVVLAALTCFFLLVDGERFLRWLDDKIPLDRDVRERLYGAFSDTAISTIWATLAAAATQATVIATGFWWLGVPGAVLAAGATFVFAWIPMLGSFPVWAAGAIYLYTQGSVSRTVAMVVIGLIAGVVDNFVRPIVLRGRSDIHPLVSIIAIFGGIQMFGLIGVFLGPTLLVTLQALLTIWPVVARRFGLIEAEQSLVTSPEPWIEAEAPTGLVVEKSEARPAVQKPRGKGRGGNA